MKTEFEFLKEEQKKLASLGIQFYFQYCCVDIFFLLILSFILFMLTPQVLSMFIVNLMKSVLKYAPPALHFCLNLLPPNVPQILSLSFSAGSQEEGL